MDASAGTNVQKDHRMCASRPPPPRSISAHTGNSRANHSATAGPHQNLNALRRDRNPDIDGLKTPAADRLEVEADGQLRPGDRQFLEQHPLVAKIVVQIAIVDANRNPVADRVVNAPGGLRGYV